MDKLQELLNLLSLLAAVALLSSAFYHFTTACMRGRKNNIIQGTATVPVLSSAISPTLIGTTLLAEM